MKFIFTVEDYNKIRSQFLNLNVYTIIDVKNIIINFGFDPENLSVVQSIIVSNQIQDNIIKGLKSKRIRGIIYISYKLNSDKILSIIHNTLEMIKQKEIEQHITFSLLDNSINPKCEDLYEFVDEVIFFTSITKIRVVDCVPFMYKNF